jgi:hypothetical protein
MVPVTTRVTVNLAARFSVAITIIATNKTKAATINARYTRSGSRSATSLDTMKFSDW